VLPHGLHTPSDIPVQSDPPTLDNMLISHTCDFDHAGYTHARNVQHTSLPSPSSAQTHTMPAIRDAISKLHLKVRKGKIKGPTLRVHCRTAITNPNITGTKPFEAASKVMWRERSHNWKHHRARATRVPGTEHLARKWPPYAAACSASKMPFPQSALTSVPQSSSSFTTASCPFPAARGRGFRP
jgi:hypothetical protein